MIRQAGAWGLLLAAAAVLGGAAAQHPLVVLAAVAVVVLLLLLTKPAWAAVGAVSLLPVQTSVVPGAGLAIGASDLLLVTALVGWALADVLRPPDDAGPGALGAPARTVRPLALGLLAYSGAVVVTMVANPSGVGVVTAVQRAEIVVGALLVGGGLVRHGKLAAALEGFVLLSCATAVAAVVQRGGEVILGAQKNPAAGFIAAALIYVVVLRPGRRWAAYAPVLALGLLAAQSRGALVGIVVAAVVTLVVVRRGERVKLAALFAGATVLFAVGYRSLSAGQQERLLNLTGQGEYAVTTRVDFQADAFDAFRSSPWWGIGVGNYNGGARYPGIRDPHQVLYLELAEGGVVLTVAFVVLVLVSLVVSLRALGRTKLAVVALAIQVSTVTHAMFDVYWVRGTPAPAFLLLGATLAVVSYAARGDARADPWLRPGASMVLPAVPELLPAGEPRAG